MNAELLLEIQKMIQETDLSFPDIAQQLNISVDTVYDVAEDMGEFDD